MGPDSHGDCSCPTQHRCSTTSADDDPGSTSASTACIDDEIQHTGRIPDDSCYLSKFGTCYEPLGVCAPGTDCTDCGTCGPPVRASWHWHAADCAACRCTPSCDTSLAPYISCKSLGLTSMAGVVVKNKEATIVDLSRNKLTTLSDPSLFHGMTALTALVLFDNQFAELEADQFAGLTALTFLSLSDNQLTVLWGTQFYGLTALTDLDLNDNLMADLDAALFNGLTALTELSLFNNLITELKGSQFVNLTALTKLDLDNNQIRELNPNVFVSLTSLTTLHLSKNHLAAIDGPTFSPLADTITQLFVADNHILRIDAVLVEIYRNNSRFVLTMASLATLSHPSCRESARGRGRNGSVP